MYLTGYNIGPIALRTLAERADGSYAQTVAAIARTSNIAILYGYPEASGRSAIFNAVQLVGADGQALHRYRKTHLYGALDRAHFSQSNRPPGLVELNGWRIGVLICYDVEFPETVRMLAAQGADLVVVPTANMLPFDIVPSTVVSTRAYENQLYLAYANYCGREGNVTYGGLSRVVSPNGEPVATAGRSEALVFADLDRTVLDTSRETNTYLLDRRPNLYRVPGHRGRARVTAAES